MKKILGYNKWLNESHKSFGYDPDDWKEMAEILYDIESSSIGKDPEYIQREIGKLIPIEDKNPEYTIKIIMDLLENGDSLGNLIENSIKKIIGGLNLKYDKGWINKEFDKDRWNRVK